MNIQQFLEEEKQDFHKQVHFYIIPTEIREELFTYQKEYSTRLINKVLDELQILVLKHPNTYECEEELVFRTTLKEISTIIDQLKLK